MVNPQVGLQGHPVLEHLASRARANAHAAAPAGPRGQVGTARMSLSGGGRLECRYRWGAGECSWFFSGRQLERPELFELLAQRGMVSPPAPHREQDDLDRLRDLADHRARAAVFTRSGVASERMPPLGLVEVTIRSPYARCAAWRLDGRVTSLRELRALLAARSLRP